MSSKSIEERIEKANEIVGSEEHHSIESQIAKEAITLLKNENLTLPISGVNKKIVLLGRNSWDYPVMQHAVRQLIEEGLIPEDAYVCNMITETEEGNPESGTKVVIDYYVDTAWGPVHYTDELKSAIQEADAVLCLTKAYDAWSLHADNAQYIGINEAIKDVHSGGGKFIMLSGNLPYDAARYPEADAILAAYLETGSDIDPTERGAANTRLSYNANVIEAIRAAFDDLPPTGVLPVNVPGIVDEEEGMVSFSDEIVYERGLGLWYNYQFIEGMNSVYDKENSNSLNFRNNARLDKLQRVLVDGKELEARDYSLANDFTNITLNESFLKTLAGGEHTLTAVYNYVGDEFPVEAGFMVLGTEEVPETQEGDGEEPGDKTEPGDSKEEKEDQKEDNKEDNKEQKSEPLAASAGSGAPKTGDTNNPALYVIMLVLSIYVLTVLKKENNRRK